MKENIYFPAILVMFLNLFCFISPSFGEITGTCNGELADMGLQLLGESSLFRVARKYVIGNRTALETGPRIYNSLDRPTFEELLETNGVDEKTQLQTLIGDLATMYSPSKEIEKFNNTLRANLIAPFMMKLFKGEMRTVYGDEISNVFVYYLKQLPRILEDGSIFVPGLPDLKAAYETRNFGELNSQFMNAQDDPKIMAATKKMNALNAEYHRNINEENSDKLYAAYKAAAEQRLELLQSIRSEKLGNFYSLYLERDKSSVNRQYIADTNISRKVREQQKGTPSRKIIPYEADYSPYFLVFLSGVGYESGNHLGNALKEIATDPSIFYSVYALEFNIINKNHGDLYKKTIAMKEQLGESRQRDVYRYLAHLAAHSVKTDDLENRDEMRSKIARYIFSFLSYGIASVENQTFTAPEPKDYFLPTDILNLIQAIQESKPY